MNKVTLGEKEIDVFEVIDAKNLSCPMPLLKTKKEITKLVGGQVLQIDVTDPNSQKDILGWCQRSENIYLGEKTMNNFISVFIRKSS
jgi:tRNA 2-thiouridine synthesizing protein A